MPRNTLAAFDLKAARKVRGLSQVAVARILCTTQPSVARWEAQGNMPEVYRKVWELHWQLETIKAGDKSNDSGSDKRARKSNARKRKTESGKTGIEGGKNGSTSGASASAVEST